MNNIVRVNEASDISKAVEFVRQFTESIPHEGSMQVSSLICEEVLLELLGRRCTDITVSIRGVFVKYIDIRGRGARSDTADPGTKSEEERIGSQINGCILEQYADYYSFRYQNGVNRYRVFARKREVRDLTDEIYAYYEDEKRADSQNSLDVLFYIARNHWPLIILGISILLVRHLGALMLSVFVSNIINSVQDTGTFFSRTIFINILLSLVSLAVNLICFWLDTMCYRRFARAVEAGFRMAFVQKLHVLSMKYHNESQSGVVLSKLASDMQFIELMIYDRFIEILLFVEDVVFISIVALTTFPLMLVFYLLIVPAVVFMIRRFSKVLQESRAGMRKKNEQVNAAFKEMLDMESLIRSHGLEKTEYGKLLLKVRSAQRASIAYDTRSVMVNNITFGGFQGLRLMSLSFAAFLLAAGYINVGTLVLFQSIFDMMISNVQRVLDAIPLITQGYDSLISVNEILFAKDTEQNGTKKLGQVRGEIEFKNVTFGYDKEREPVLKDVSFKVPAGGCVALVGRSGQGKTTILNLILGLYSAVEGDVLIDGTNMDELEKNSYRRNVAVVPQNTVLFSGTLWDNLAYGLSYVSTEEVQEVIRSVGLEDLVNSLPEGLHSQINENGGNLSGGQRQRISIARALLRNPRIIILDEATSALDSVSERQVQAAIEAMIGRCTVIMAAHRLRTLRHADSIFRVSDGRLISCESLEEAERELEGGETN